MKKIILLLFLILTGCYSTTGIPSVDAMNRERFRSDSWRGEIHNNSAKIFILNGSVESIWRCEYAADYSFSFCEKIK